MNPSAVSAAGYKQLQESADDIDQAIRALAVRCGLVPHPHTYQPLRCVLAAIEKHVDGQARELKQMREAVGHVQQHTNGTVPESEQELVGAIRAIKRDRSNY